jgi:rhamnosyltransferase
VIAAIIVLYNPELNGLQRLLNAINNQVDKILLVDNNSGNISSSIFELRNHIEYIRLNANFGIAHAQNIGIEKALNQGADYILLLDQDSIPSNALVDELSKALLEESVAASGSAYYDPRSQKTSFFVTQRKGVPQRWAPTVEGVQENMPTVDAAFLIASGTLIKSSALKKIGAMRSDYFIDHVDTEWCFRIRNAGYRIVGTPSAVMEHSLGDEVRRAWFFGWRQVAYHSPLRDYYMFRNTLLMIRDTPMSLVWKCHLLWRLLQFASYFLTFTPSRKDRFIKMSLGIMHGLKNIRGKLDINTNTCHAIPKTELDPACLK